MAHETGVVRKTDVLVLVVDAVAGNDGVGVGVAVAVAIAVGLLLVVDDKGALDVDLHGARVGDGIVQAANGGGVFGGDGGDTGGVSVCAGMAGPRHAAVLD